MQHARTAMFYRWKLITGIKRNSQWSGVTGGAVTFTRNVVAASTVSTTALLGTVLSIAVGGTFLIAIHTGPAPRTHTFTVERIARGPVLTLAIHLAISAPFTQRAPCYIHTRVKNNPLRTRRLNELFISANVKNYYTIVSSIVFIF